MSTGYEGWWPPQGGGLTITNPKYDCPVHGKTEHVIQVRSMRDDLNGMYCMICAVERMVAAGIPKVERVSE